MTISDDSPSGPASRGDVCRAHRGVRGTVAVCMPAHVPELAEGKGATGTGAPWRRVA